MLGITLERKPSSFHMPASEHSTRLLGSCFLTLSSFVLDLGQEDGKYLANDLPVDQGEVQSRDGCEALAPAAVPILRGPGERPELPLAAGTDARAGGFSSSSIQIRGRTGNRTWYMSIQPPKIVPASDLRHDAWVMGTQQRGS